jgi:hypothetical protein
MTVSRQPESQQTHGSSTSNDAREGFAQSQDGTVSSNGVAVEGSGLRYSAAWLLSVARVEYSDSWPCACSRVTGFDSD